MRRPVRPSKDMDAITSPSWAAQMVSYSARAPTEVIAQVPFVMPRPSLETRVSSVLMPALAMASAPGIFTPSYMASPLPSMGSVM